MARKKMDKPADDEFEKMLAQIEAESKAPEASPEPPAVVEIVPDEPSQEEPAGEASNPEEPAAPSFPTIMGDDPEEVMRAAMAQFQGTVKAPEPEPEAVPPEEQKPPEPALRVRPLPRNPPPPKVVEPPPPPILSARISAQTMLEIEAGRARVEARKKGQIA